MVGCELSTEQEMALNRDINLIVDSRNQGDALMYLGLTHPSIVRHFKDQGDSAVKQRFQQLPPHTNSRYYYQFFDENYFIWERHYQRGIQKEEGSIQVKIRVNGYFTDDSGKDSSFYLYAISSDKGLSWSFAEEQDYYSDYFTEIRFFETD